MNAQTRAEHLTSVLAADSPALLNYLQRRAGIQDSPDLLAEVMVVAWRRISALPKDPEQARMWLFGIARNILSDHARGERRRWRLAGRRRRADRRERFNSSWPLSASPGSAASRVIPRRSEATDTVTLVGPTWIAETNTRRHCLLFRVEYGDDRAMISSCLVQ